MTIRLALIIFIFVSLYFSLGVRAYNLQIAEGDALLARAQLQFGAPFAPRGTIFITDENGQNIPAALNKKTPIIYVVPDEITDPQEYSELLHQITGVAYEALYRSLSKERDPYERIMENPTEQQIRDIQDAQIKGVYIEEQQQRFYPLESLAAHVIGFVSETREDSVTRGRYGIEALYEDTLAGAGKESGAPVYLAIEQRIQAEGERIIKNLVEKYGAESGLFIVQDPSSGIIRAMGGTPSFNPNTYGTYPLNNFLNGAVQAVYEPGSVFKIFTMAAGIDTGQFTPETTYYDTGEITLNGRTIRNWDKKAYGTTTMTGVLEHSLNVGAALAQRKIGKELFLEYVKKFGFGEKTHINLPGEVEGNIRTLTEEAREINYATASFGHGISVTPIGLIAAASSIANGGTLMRPSITQTEPYARRTVITKETARSITEMMVSAVDTAQVARISGYSVAGKTGTAQIPDFSSGGYSDDVVNTYVGYAPAYNPKFTILIKLERPKGTPLAGQTVVPAFRDFAEFILHYLQIPPDRPQPEHD